MKIETAIKQATRHLLNSDKARTYHTKLDTWSEKKSYILALRPVYHNTYSDGRPIHPYMEVLTWGFDNESFEIPQNRTEVVNLKCRAQLGIIVVPEIVLRYTLDILRRADS